MKSVLGSLVAVALVAGCSIGPSVDPETGLTVEQQRQIVFDCVGAQEWSGQYEVETKLTSDAVTVILGDSPQMPPQVRAAVDSCIATKTAQLSTTGATPSAITDQTMDGKFGATSETMASSAEFRSNLMRETQPTTMYGCVPGRGVLQRGTLICPGQGG